jgi:hypothetical protein
MRSGATSASSFADVAISSAMAASGRFHSPATRARATCTPRPGGAKWLNCGSVMLLTDGMIMPMRARGAGKEPSSCRSSIVVTVAMIVPSAVIGSGVPGWRRANARPGIIAPLDEVKLARGCELLA